MCVMWCACFNHFEIKYIRKQHVRFGFITQSNQLTNVLHIMHSTGAYWYCEKRKYKWKIHISSWKPISRQPVMSNEKQFYSTIHWTVNSVYGVFADTRLFDHTDQTTSLPRTSQHKLARLPGWLSLWLCTLSICLGSKLIQLIAQRTKRTQIIINYAYRSTHRTFIYDISKCNLEAISIQINCGHTVAHKV